MKILKANIFFVLREDFEGGINEALEEWALYKDFAVGSYQAGEPKSSVDSVSLIANNSLGYKTIFQTEIWTRGCNGDWRRDFEPVPDSKIKDKATIK